ncbi:MAG: flavin reductase [Burkholderiales bacterium]|nr:flavin reductase [Burkholderiales bacterium]
MERNSITNAHELFRRITHGVYVIGVACEAKRDGFTAAWVVQASFDPLLLAVSINPGNASYRLLQASGGFTVNVLRRGQLDLARRFGTRSGREGDKLAGVSWHPAASGAPVFDAALAYFDCRVAGSLKAGDHELVVGHVVDGAILDADAVPMTYAETGDMDGSGALYPEPVGRSRLP